MDFLALSLPEAAYLYMGLAIQALVRSSSLRQLPRVLVLGWTLVLLWRAQGRPGGYRTLCGYVGTCLVLLILFWPEAVPFGRPFASVMPMQWLLGVDLTADITSAIADWVYNCYLPVQTGTMEGQEGRTIEELLPWGDTPMRRGLTTREVVPGAQTGINWLRGP